jgi:glycosyltransferase involved in cell wall biosynthesis
MKRVLHVLYTLERSGMEVMLLNSGPEWKRHGFLCDVLATARDVGSLAHEMRTMGYPVYHLPFRSRLSLLPRMDFVRDFLRLCQSGYDVIHIHTEGGAPLFAFLAWIAGVRRIALTPHNTFRFTGLLRFRKMCERQFVRLLGGCYGMISEGVRACERDRFHNDGAAVSNWIDTAYFKPPSEVERIHARRSLGIRPEHFVIVSTGNCNRIKNHEAILRAIPLLPPAIKPLYLHLGREQAGYPDRRLATSLGIQDRVRFCGSQADVLPFLWAADAFVMPSFHEGLGMAAIEAVASGVPLICAEADGLLDIAAATKYTVLTSTSAASVAEGIAYAASLPIAELRNRALEDSRSVRERFSMVKGVRSIVSALYADQACAVPEAAEVWEHS